MNKRSASKHVVAIVLGLLALSIAFDGIFTKPSQATRDHAGRMN